MLYAHSGILVWATPLICRDQEPGNLIFVLGYPYMRFFHFSRGALAACDGFIWMCIISYQRVCFMRLSRVLPLIFLLIFSLVLVSGCTSDLLYGTPFASPTPTVTTPAPATCEMENCHGLEIRCGANPVNFCTAVYTPGDRCRQYASCRIVQGSCQVVTDPKFETCKGCIDMCSAQYGNSPNLMASCEQKC